VCSAKQLICDTPGDYRQASRGASGIMFRNSLHKKVDLDHFDQIQIRAPKYRIRATATATILRFENFDIKINDFLNFKL
jgi:hypothetical protein